MFKVVDTMICWWPVKVKEPSAEKIGEFEEYEFEIELELLDRDQVKADEDEKLKLIEKAGPSDKDVRKLRAELEALDDKQFVRVIRNWRGIEAGEGKTFAYSAANLKLLLKRNHIRNAISKAYREAIGEDEARLGN